MRDAAVLNKAWCWFGPWALVLGGCGGGGGSDAPPPPTSGATPLALNDQNAVDAAISAAGSGEVVLQLGQLAADYAGRFTRAATPLAATETCPNGGVLALALRDRDGSGAASAGDTVNVDLHDCGVGLIGQVLSGAITIQVTAASAAPGVGVAGTLDFGNGASIVSSAGPVAGVTVQLLGTLAFDWQRTALRTTLAVASTAADDLRLVGSGNGKTITEALRAITASKSVRLDEARSVVSLALRNESDVMGGSVTLRTLQPLLAYLNTYPETGLLEVRGGGAGVVRIRPHFVTASEQFDAEFDRNGDGVAEVGASVPWLSAAQGFLWWDGKAPLTWSSQPYSTQNYLATAFDYRITPPAATSINEGWRLQFSRPPVNPPTLQFRLRDFGSTVSFDPVLRDIPANVTQQGAHYLIQPAEPLRHARSYWLELSPDGVNWNTTVSFHDALNNTVNLNGFVASFQTPDTLRAIITASNTVLASAGASLQLDASASISTLRPIASFAWRQLGGTPLVLSAPTSASTQVSLGTTPPVGLEKIEIELTITDTAGEIEMARFTVSALNPVVTGQVLYFRSTAGDYIGGGQTTLVSDTTGNFSANPANAGSVSYNYNDNDASSGIYWFLTLASADGSPLRAGAYENAIRAPFHDTSNGLELFGSGRGCNQIAGRFDVLEVATDPQGTITRLAVDFEQHCESAQAPPLWGSLRVNSSLPIRP
jgi:hypothetical protein